MVSALNTMGVMSPLSVATATLISTLLYLQKTHLSVPLETTSDLSVTTTTLISTLLYLQKTHLSVPPETTSDLSVSSVIDIYVHCCACKKPICLLKFLCKQHETCRAAKPSLDFSVVIRF